MLEGQKGLLSRTRKISRDAPLELAGTQSFLQHFVVERVIHSIFKCWFYYIEVGKKTSHQVEATLAHSLLLF